MVFVSEEFTLTGLHIGDSMLWTIRCRQRILAEDREYEEALLADQLAAIRRAEVGWNLLDR